MMCNSGVDLCLHANQVWSHWIAVQLLKHQHMVNCWPAAASEATWAPDLHRSLQSDKRDDSIITNAWSWPAVLQVCQGMELASGAASLPMHGAGQQRCYCLLDMSLLCCTALW